MKRILLLGVFLASLSVLAFFQVASAATITVTSAADNTTDDAFCTLREAIISANTDSNAAEDACVQGSGADVIEFDVSLSLPITIGLTGAANENLASTGDLDITADLTINGLGMTDTVIDANQVDRIFEIATGADNVTLQDMTLKGGNSSGSTPQDGGAIRVADLLNTLNLNRMMITMNSSLDRGGAVYTDGNLNITDSTISTNNANQGGGLYIDANGDLRMDNTTVGPSNTAANEGGGIFNLGTMEITNSSISDNNSSIGPGGGLAIEGGSLAVILSNTEINRNTSGNDGGGIYSNTNSGMVTISQSTISGNDSNISGGGIWHNGATMTIKGSTLSRNTAIFMGGGIYNLDDMLNISNSTISGNESRDSGGGIFNSQATGTVDLTNVTITQNQTDTDGDVSGDGGGIANVPGGTIKAVNTIIAGNSDLSPDPMDQEPDCSGELDSQDFNLIGDITGCTPATNFNGDIIGEDPLLGALTDNGGATRTHALLAGSLAINAGDDTECVGELAQDQRGVDRVGICDIGAFEFSCGNGTVELGESCDDGNTSDDGNGCTADCQDNSVCGDGTVQDVFEACDDGNNDAGDGCAADCTNETSGGGSAVCGDGVVDTGEECDDGNTTDGDGCSSTCVDETSGAGTSGGCSLIR